MVAFPEPGQGSGKGAGQGQDSGRARNLKVLARFYGSERLGAADSRATALGFGWIVLAGRCR